MKTWSPDTCPVPSCIIEEIYVGTTIVGGGQVIQKCPAHLGVPDANLYDVLLNGENRRKNGVMRALLGYEGFSVDLHETKTNPDGSTYIDFKSTVTVAWAFSGSGATRSLTVTITGVNLTDDQKTLVNNFCTTQFCAGKVVLVN